MIFTVAAALIGTGSLLVAQIAGYRLVTAAARQQEQDDER